jgi:hypothetical protein
MPTQGSGVAAIALLQWTHWGHHCSVVRPLWPKKCTLHFFPSLIRNYRFARTRPWRRGAFLKRRTGGTAAMSAGSSASRSATSPTPAEKKKSKELEWAATANVAEAKLKAGQPVEVLMQFDFHQLNCNFHSLTSFPVSGVPLSCSVWFRSILAANQCPPSDDGRIFIWLAQVSLNQSALALARAVQA